MWPTIATATVAMVGVLLVNHGARDAAATVVVVVVLILSLPRWGIAIHRLLLLDLAVSMAVWWLYGPISGAAMITLAVVAVAPLLLDTKTTRLLLVVALITVPLEMAFHFLAGVVDLPLFHPPDPVPTWEFVVGELIKAGLLVGVGVLMMSVAEMLRRGRRALAADLERERELSRLKDRFVATVSHQLRTPLTSLKGFTRTLLDEDVGPDDRIEFLEIMADQADELHGRIEDLITFSRIGAGGVTIRPQSVQLSLLASQSIGELGAVAEGVVENKVPRELLVWVDPPRIKQVLRNLLDNALEYGAPPGGTGHDRLPAMGGGAKTGRTIHRRAVVVAFHQVGRAGMDRCSHPDRTWRRPNRRGETSLDIGNGGRGIDSRAKHDKLAVTFAARLDHEAATSLDHIRDQLVVATQRLQHRLRRLLP